MSRIQGVAVDDAPGREHARARPGTDPRPVTDDRPGAGPVDRSARAASIVFWCSLAAAGPLLMVLGNQRWFGTDEWGFLVAYSLDSPSGLFTAENGHWSTIPVLLFQLLYEVVGLRSYAAYQVLSVGAHLLAVVMLRWVMRRARVRPWTATIAAIALLLFGAGLQNVVVAIQVSFVLAFVLALVQVRLADHDGGVSWRDGLGVVAGIAALMCSAVGVAMIPVVAIAVLLRRGRRIAALQVVPVVATFAVWYVIARPAASTTSGPEGTTFGTVVSKVAEWDVQGEISTFAALGGVPWLGAAVAALLVGGLVVAWRPLRWSEFRRSQFAPVALPVGGLAFLTLTGYGRWMLNGVDDVGSRSRYVYMVAACTIPALAVAADALMRRWRAAIPVVAGIAAVAMAANVVAFTESTPHLGPQWDRHRDVVLASARSPLAPRVSSNLRVDPARAFGLDIGWLLEADREGRLPDPGPIDPEVEAEIPVRLGLRQGLFGPRLPACERVTSTTIAAPVGEVFRIVASPDASIGVTSLDPSGTASPEVSFIAAGGRFFFVELPDQRLQVRAVGPGATLEVCRA